MPLALKSDFAKEVKHFIDTLNGEVDLSLFYQNLETLEIEKVEKAFGNTNFDGEYDVFDNKIYITPFGLKRNCIYHELFHAASTLNDDMHNYSGFQRRNIDLATTFGMAINEGFTEVLANRYFKTEYISYYIELIYVSKLSQLLGFDKMRELYFRADFDGFIEEFAKYTSKEEVFTFIDLLDRYTYNSTFKKRYDNDEIQNYIMVCSNILIRAFANKMKLSDADFDERAETMINYIDEFAAHSFEFVDSGLSLSMEPSLFIIKEAFDKVQIEYIEMEDGIDISPYLDKKEGKVKTRGSFE